MVEPRTLDMRYLLRPSGAKRFGVYLSPSNGDFVTKDWDESIAMKLARDFNAAIGREFDADRERARIQRQHREQ